MSIQWKTKKGKELLNSYIKSFGKTKLIQIIGYDGENRYFKVATKRILTIGIKAKDLLDKKYGKELSKTQFEKEEKI